MSIDSSVYVSTSDGVEKYSGGLMVDFVTAYPEENVIVQKVITNESLQEVYVWDKTKGVVYILGKNGQYQRQVQSAILKNSLSAKNKARCLVFLGRSNSKANRYLNGELVAIVIEPRIIFFITVIK